MQVDAESDDENESVMEHDEDENDDDKKATNKEIYLPGQELEKGMILDYDSTAYLCMHSLNLEWPCLSFDFLSDHLGESRTKVDLAPSNPAHTS